MSRRRQTACSVMRQLPVCNYRWQLRNTAQSTVIKHFTGATVERAIAGHIWLGRIIGLRGRAGFQARPDVYSIVRWINREINVYPFQLRNL